MAVRLTAWLEEICATQLLLGNLWLSDRDQARDGHRQTGVKLDPDRDWEGLYHDNGSSLDITNDTPPGRNCYLTISKPNPLQLTDGHSHLPAQIAPFCAAKLFPRPPRLWDTILVHTYTIRYTSYGPPRHKLTLVVESAAWVGDIVLSDITKLPLLQSEELVAAFRRLDETRAAQDYRCLGTASHASEEANTIQSAMDQADERSRNASQAQTQYAFGTQMPHQSRPRSFEDEPQILSVKSLEPILAGNTQREDIPPRAAAPQPNPADLLRLLQRQPGPAASEASTKNSNLSLQNALQKTPRKTPKRPQVPPDSTRTQMHTQLSPHANRHPTQTNHSNARTSSLPTKARTSQGPMRAVNRQAVSPTNNRKTEQLEGSVPVVPEAQPQANHLQSLAAQCTWMQGMEFTRESFRVPSDQMSLLRSDGSWHKPLPGHRFPDGNVPIGVLTTLHRMADEAAAMEAAPDSDEEMDEDPSPEFPIESVDPSPDAAPEPSQDADIATSQVSWSASPSPVPPKLLTRPNQQLPPDSSFEAAHIPDVGSVKDKAPTAVTVESSNEIGNADEQHVLSSSPPATFDDDVEMEEYVPQGLGDDSVGGANEVQPDFGRSISSPPDSVVQVHRTPYIKGTIRQHHPEVSPSMNDPTSNKKTKHTSYVSIVHGTYNDKTAFNAREEAVPLEEGQSELEIRENAHSDSHGPDEDRLENRNATFRDGPRSVAVQDHAVDKVPHGPLQQEPGFMPLQLTHLSLVQDLNHPESSGSGDQSIHEGMGGPVVLAPQTPTTPEQQPQANSMSKQALNSASPAPKRAKRKHGDSPTKGKSRHSKRREIKIVGFGDDPPISKDPVLPFREDSLRQLQESRRSNTTSENHDRSSNMADGRESVDAMQIDSLGSDEGDAPAPGMSPRHESLYEDPGDTVSKAARMSPVNATQTVSDDTGLTVFLSFKAAYPEYTGDVKHFKEQCNQMIQLDDEDKMVPKWQWDDYIIRNRSDFKEYALQCVDQGENPEPYHRFYKDNIRDTLYNKGIVASRVTLLKAQHELNDGMPQRELQMQSDVTSRKPKRSRASLPSAFDQTKATLKGRTSGLTHERSRHSLPAKSQRSMAALSENVAPAKGSTSTPRAPRGVARISRSTLQADTSSRASLKDAASSRALVDKDATTRTGDQFRDFCFAYKRTTSITGSTNVSRKKS